MHILLVADGRSPITRRWIGRLRALEYRVTLVSTYPCADIPGVEARYVLPVAFGNLAGSQVGGARAAGSTGGARSLARRFRSMVVGGRYLFGTLTLPGYGRRLQRLVRSLQPDLVHALRIPFEGMLATFIPAGLPLAASIWGNDLTLHAQRSPAMARYTSKTLLRADGLIADARRDIRLGMEWGFPAGRPTLVVPGSGGIDLDELERVRSEFDSLSDTFPAGVPLVINPRGFRPGSVRTEVFFQSIPLILSARPGVVFLCPGMAGQSEALRWVERLKIQNQVRLLPYLTQHELWDLFFRADVSISVSAHDGTPNSLLEAMACGCFPVAGDIESLREWITPGLNGLLVEPDKPQALAEAVLIALSRPQLRTSAAEINRKLVAARAAAELVAGKVDAFYRQVCGQGA